MDSIKSFLYMPVENELLSGKLATAMLMKWKMFTLTNRNRFRGIKINKRYNYIATSFPSSQENSFLISAVNLMLSRLSELLLIKSKYLWHSCIFRIMTSWKLLMNIRTTCRQRIDIWAMPALFKQIYNSGV